MRTRNVSKEVMVVPKEWKMTKIRKEGNFKPRKMIFKEKKRFSMVSVVYIAMVEL